MDGMEIKNITVLGSGIMGHGIAQVSAMAGYNVILRDIEQQFLDKAMEKISWSLNKLVSKEKISEEQRNEIFSRIRPIVDLNEAEAGDNISGSIIKIEKHAGIIVVTGTQGLLIENLQLEGKKAMRAYDFVNGHNLRIGDVFGC